MPKAKNSTWACIYIFFLVSSEAVPKVLLFSFVGRKMAKEKRSVCTRTMNSAETGTGISEISGPQDWRWLSHFSVSESAANGRKRNIWFCQILLSKEHLTKRKACLGWSWTFDIKKMLWKDHSCSDVTLPRLLGVEGLTKWANSLSYIDGSASLLVSMAALFNVPSDRMRAEKVNTQNRR